MSPSYTITGQLHKTSTPRGHEWENTIIRCISRPKILTYWWLNAHWSHVSFALSYRYALAFRVGKFLRSTPAIYHHCFYGTANQSSRYYWNEWWPNSVTSYDIKPQMASLSHNELINHFLEKVQFKSSAMVFNVFFNYYLTLRCKFAVRVASCFCFCVTHWPLGDADVILN